MSNSQEIVQEDQQKVIDQRKIELGLHLRFEMQLSWAKAASDADISVSRLRT